MSENFYDKVTVIILALSLMGILLFSVIGLKFKSKFDSKLKSTYSTTQYKA